MKGRPRKPTAEEQTRILYFEVGFKGGTRLRIDYPPTRVWTIEPAMGGQAGVPTVLGPCSFEEFYKELLALRETKRAEEGQSSTFQP